MEEVAPGVHDIPMSIVHAFLLVDEQQVTLVDCGLPRRRHEIEQALASVGKRVDDLGAVVLTHHHNDHMGNLAELRRVSGCTVYAHRDDASVVSGEDVPPRRGLMARFVSKLNSAERCTVDHVIATEETLPIAGGLHVLHTPGHTSGHVCFLLEREGGTLFVGDAAVCKDGKVDDPPPQFTADMRAARQSIAKLAALDFAIACFGHGPVIRTSAADRFREFAATTG